MCQRLLSHECLGLLLAAALAGCGGGRDDSATMTTDAGPVAATHAAPATADAAPTAALAAEDVMPDPDGARAAAVADDGPVLDAVSVTETTLPESAATLAAAPPAVEDSEPAATADTVAEAA